MDLQELCENLVYASLVRMGPRGRHQLGVLGSYALADVRIALRVRYQVGGVMATLPPISTSLRLVPVH